MTEDDARTQQTGGGFEHWGVDLHLPGVQDAVVETLERFRKNGDVTDGAEIRHKDTELLQARTLRRGRRRAPARRRPFGCMISLDQ